MKVWVRALDLCIISIEMIFKALTCDEPTHLGVNADREGKRLQCAEVGGMLRGCRKQQRKPRRDG